MKIPKSKKIKDRSVVLSEFGGYQDVINNIPKGLSACIYTQLSDVEEECNGFTTFDREIVKVKIDDIRLINDKIRY